jgi:hypothetical protein
VQPLQNATQGNKISSSCILRDLSAAFMQQMFFWGMDAASPFGNLFVKRGFTKFASPGLKGTSCYSLPWEQGQIFLHGACVGWIPNEGSTGLIFIRPKGKCFRWMDEKPPVPGNWPSGKMAAPSLSDDLPAITAFLSWWLDHEAWISAEMGSVYRENCHRKYKSLPKSKPWLAPSDATAWLTLLMEKPADTPRAKRLTRLQAA